MKKKTTPQLCRPASRMLHQATLALLSAVMAAPAMAGLPPVEPPSSGGGGGLMDTIKGYAQDGIVLIGLILAAVGFVYVAMAVIHTFAEVRDGKANWGKFGGIFVVGVILLVIVIWLVGKSAEILL